MINLTIDGRKIKASEGMTILAACKKNGIKIPTLCWYKDLNDIAACRICLVEIEGQDQLFASCATPVEEGMVIHTNTPKVINARKCNLELILSQHKTECTSCVRNNNCTLQTLTEEFNVTDVPYAKEEA
ncbi:MAG: 2Fe-2S iron-sulfur cluster-binding protein, partial [Coriobacteriales bacterium]|nr:2Fe-2S iron-sulfur cluster-binding protein [Coriobacteriales bacterium]